ncbi:chromosome segregation protein SMC, partial [[Clostridium] scindens]|nr:chromosome segregation protein SMC [[Clostridium] scindens]
QNIANVEAINFKVRANLDKDIAEEDAKILRDNYDQLTAKLNDVRKQKTDLLHNANLPLPELSVEDGEIIYEGQKWDNMSGS